MFFRKQLGEFVAIFRHKTHLRSLLASATLLGSAAAVFAASYTEDLVAQLVSLGFSDITAETTLLGRVKIRASRADGMREVVINPRTGEILRDIWIPSGNGAPRTVLNDVDGNGQSGSGRDDDGSSGSGSGDDNSGPGSSGGDDNNSGSGSGDDDNSGSGSDDDRGDDREDREDRDKNERD